MAAPTPSHLVELEGGWRMWRRFCLRGAGFPEAEVEKLALPETARALDRLRALERQAEARRAEAIARAAQLHKQARLAGREDEKALEKVLKRLRAGHTDASDETVTGLGPLVAEAHAAVELVRLARAELERLYATEQAEVKRALRAIAGDGRFREAVTWQNPVAIVTGLDALLRRPPLADDAETRRAERMVANYLQRFCVKADTIGFFGPIGWGRIEGEGAIALRPGAALIAEREVFFEYWAVSAIAEALGAGEEMEPHLAPRRLPTVRLDGAKAIAADGGAVELTADEARLIAACDGETTARALAAALAIDERRLCAALGDLAARGLIRWALEVPVSDPHPERLLRARLERIADPALRASRLAALDQLLARRDEVARASGDADALCEAIDRAHQAFTRLTDRDPVRRSGSTYAGRTVLYLDCRRDVALTLGQELVSELARPLALLTESMRWFSYTATARLCEHFRAVHRRLAEAGGGDEVPFLAFWKLAEAETMGGNLVAREESRPILRQVVDEFQARWAKILALAPEQRREQRRAADLADAVRDAFAAPHASGPTTCYHSPDVLIAADGADAIARGDYQFVLGEIHAGNHTFCMPLFLALCPDAEDVVRARDLDLPGVEVLPIMNRDRYLRVNPRSYHRDFHVEVGDARSWLPRARVLAAADLVVAHAEPGGELLVRTRDRRRGFDLATFLDFYLTRAFTSEARMIAPMRHTPRVAIDRLVVMRETWRFGREELPFAASGHGLPQLGAARGWAEAHGLPRRVFVKVPEEKKPFYVDFDSAVLVEQLAHVARQASAVTVAEMLPAVGQSWLTDGDGRRYVGELRLITVDPKRAPQVVLGGP